MAAGVHHADVVLVLVQRPHLTRVIEAGLLDDGQGVHVGADKDRGAGTVLEDTDDAVTADLFSYLESDFSQLGGHSCGSLLLLIGQFWMRVQVLIQRLNPIEIGGDPLVDFGDPLGELFLLWFGGEGEAAHCWSSSRLR